MAPTSPYVRSAVCAALLLASLPAFAHGGGWLARCLDDADGRLSDAECYAEYVNRLKREQSGLLRRITAALSKPGPVETDYPQALERLHKTQAHWHAYIGSDCSIVSNVFGGGNAIGFAEETCLIDHYRSRNAQLKLLNANHLGAI